MSEGVGGSHCVCVSGGIWGEDVGEEHVRVREG